MSPGTGPARNGWYEGLRKTPCRDASWLRRETPVRVFPVPGGPWISAKHGVAGVRHNSRRSCLRGVRRCSSAAAVIAAHMKVIMVQVGLSGTAQQ
jgi:hypothetical protein